MVGRLDCAVTKRDDAGRAAAGHIVAVALAGPLAGGADRLQRTGGTPLMTRALGLLEPVARNRIRFFEIAQFGSGRTGQVFAAQETAPSSLNDGYPAGNAFQP